MARIAAATSDGISVNVHFGKALFFRIYEIYEDHYEFLEVRDVIAACQHTRTHSQTDFDAVAALLHDCDAIFVQKIGQSAADYLIRKQIRVFEVNAEIEPLLNQIITDQLFSQRKITRSTKIGDLLDHPELTEILSDIGMTCFCCPSARNETVEEAAAVHGIDPDELIYLLNQKL